MRRISPRDAKPFLASKWLHIQLLIDADEMGELFKELQDFYLFSTMGIKPIGENTLSKEAFLGAYARYIELLKTGHTPNDADFRFFFTAVMTLSIDALQALDIAAGKEMIRPLEPCVQLQLHHFDYSLSDGKIRPMVFGKETISWGLQFSYPQLFQDPSTRDVVQANQYANFALFRKIQLWVRSSTLPTPFIIDGKMQREPIRIGKKCFSWIKNHPELSGRGLSVQS